MWVQCVAQLYNKEKFMRCFTVYWNEKEGEARISYADWFKPETDSGSQIVILDALNDVIWDLLKFYDTTINTEPTKETK